MRVLHLVDRLTDRGGAYRHLLGMVEALGTRHVPMIASGEDDGTARPACPTVLVAGLESRTRTEVALDALAADFAPEIVHVHTIVNPAVLEWAAQRPAAITIQDHRYFCPARGKWTLDDRACRGPMSREVCRTCFENSGYFEEILGLTQARLAAIQRLRRVTVLSRYMKEELVAVGVDGERIDVIPPFVHGLDTGAAPDGPPCILFVGRLAETKGVRDAIDAWRDSGVALPLIFAGTGPLRGEVEDAGFEVLGWLNRAQLSRTYRRAAALLLPSRWQEPFGIVGLEALAMGVPVVAYDTGGVREWHPGQGLVPWGDVAALAAALREAAEGRLSAAPSRVPQADELTARLIDTYARAIAGDR